MYIQNNRITIIVVFSILITLFSANIIGTDASSNGKTYTNKLDGKLVLPESLITNYKLKLIDETDSKHILEQIPSKDGSFSFFDVPTGSYIFEVSNLQFLFRQYRVDVSPSKSIKVKSDNDTLIQLPLAIKPVASTNYFQQRVPFSILSFITNPMFIMIGVTVLLIVVMPAMMNVIENDEETKEAFKSNSGPELLIQQLPEWHSLSIKQKQIEN